MYTNHHHPQTQYTPTVPADPSEIGEHSQEYLSTTYQVKKIIGSGEFCVVYKAVHQRTGETVALKQLKICQMFDAKERFHSLSEIRLLRKLEHPNIIRHIESFFVNNELFIVLEYADAGDLSKMLNYFRRKGERVPEKIVWNFFAQICAGLTYMHQQRAMHRDIKPANVLIYKRGTVKLSDFGFSRLLNATTDNAKTLVGTPYYMAPERLNEMEYNFSADIWSLGCLLYELITLMPPFFEENQNMASLLSKIHRLDVDYSYVDSQGHSSELGYIIRSCLILNPSDRMNILDIWAVAKRMDDQFQRHKVSAPSMHQQQSLEPQKQQQPSAYNASVVYPSPSPYYSSDASVPSQCQSISSSNSSSTGTYFNASQPPQLQQNPFEMNSFESTSSSSTTTLSPSLSALLAPGQLQSQSLQPPRRQSANPFEQDPFY